MPVITVTVSPEGDVEIEGSAFQGSSCEQATKALEDALGVQDGERTLKSEYFLAPRQTLTNSDDGS